MIRASSISLRSSLSSTRSITLRAYHEEALAVSSATHPVTVPETFILCRTSGRKEKAIRNHTRSPSTVPFFSSPHAAQFQTPAPPRAILRWRLPTPCRSRSIAPALAPHSAFPKPPQVTFPNEPSFPSNPHKSQPLAPLQTNPFSPPPTARRTAPRPTPSTLKDIAMPAP